MGVSPPPDLYPPRVAAIIVNGKRHEFEALGTVQTLLERLELNAQHVAVRTQSRNRPPGDLWVDRTR